MTSGGYGDVQAEIRRAVYGALIDKVRRDRFPSPSMMDMIESGADMQQRIDYAEALLEKVRGDRFPSTDMLKRLTGLA